MLFVHPLPLSGALAYLLGKSSPSRKNYLQRNLTFILTKSLLGLQWSTLSSSTLSRNLKEAGLTRKLLHKIAVERDEELRHDFRESLQSEDFSGTGCEFVCVDETSKNELTYARRYGRAMSGEQAHLHDVFVRGDRYSLVAAITTKGYISTQVVEGSFNAEEFYHFIAEDVVNIFACSDYKSLTALLPASTDEAIS